jgi:hypothetical protein
LLDERFDVFLMAGNAGDQRIGVGEGLRRLILSQSCRAEDECGRNGRDQNFRE